jgi:hypothetical protein
MWEGCQLSLVGHLHKPEARVRILSAQAVYYVLCYLLTVEVAVPSFELRLTYLRQDPLSAFGEVEHPFPVLDADHETEPTGPPPAYDSLVLTNDEVGLS